MMESTPQAWWWLFPLISAAGGLAGGIFGSYISKSGEISAMNDKIEQVVEQNKRIKESTEEIHSKISQRDWSIQRRWEMQRDVAIEVMRMFATLLRSASRLYELTAYYDRMVAGKQDITKGPAKEIDDEWSAAREATFAHITSYWGWEEVSRLVFSEKVQSCMRAVRFEYKQLTAAIWGHEVTEDKLSKDLDALQAKQDALWRVLRTELGF
jgi:hypothetical protein